MAAVVGDRDVGTSVAIQVADGDGDGADAGRVRRGRSERAVAGSGEDGEGSLGARLREGAVDVCDDDVFVPVAVEGPSGVPWRMVRRIAVFSL